MIKKGKGITGAPKPLYPQGYVFIPHCIFGSEGTEIKTQDQPSTRGLIGEPPHTNL